MTDSTSPIDNTQPLVVEVLDVAQQLGYPTLEVSPGVTVAGGGETWGAWAVQADQRALARVLGVLLARLHGRGVASV